jgi:hypothetical protein
MHDDEPTPDEPLDEPRPLVGRGEEGEIVIIAGRSAASFEHGQWFPGIRFDEILNFTQVRDPNDVAALIGEARQALIDSIDLVPPPANRGPPYTLLVDDNFHYMDVSHRTSAGEYDDYQRAVDTCKGIVDQFLVAHHEPGMNPDELWAAYKSFGQDPFVRPDPPPPTQPFSAWTYARQRCEEICR